MGPHSHTHRLLEAMRRRPGPPTRGRLSLAPITLGLATVVAVFLLTVLLPRLWNDCLPSGPRRAEFLQGWPLQLWRVAREVDEVRPFALIAAGVVGVVGVPLAYRSGTWRWAFRLLALAAVLADFAILYAVLFGAYALARAQAGLG